MRNFKYIIIAAIGLLFAMTSCSDGEERVRTLEVEQSSLTLNKEAQSKKIKVTFDKGSTLTATWDGGSWGGVSSVNLEEGFIEISIKENNTESLRKASVIVSLADGLRNEVINITQNGADLNVPDEVKCDFMNNEVVIDIDSKMDWAVSESKVEWMDVNVYKKSGKIIVSIKENEVASARTTLITITVGASSKEIVVVQEAALSFIMPLLTVQDVTFEEIEAFEHKRHSAVIRAVGRFDSHRALTKSNLMPEVAYSMDMFDPIIEFVSLEVKEKYMPGFFSDGTVRGKGYETLLAMGYEYLYSTGKSDFFWMDMGAEAPRHFLIRVFGENKFLTFTATNLKPSKPDLPTFNNFPYMPDAITFGSNKSIVKTWEDSNGGTLNEETDQVLIYNAMEWDPSQHYMRFYSYMPGGVDLFDVTYVFNEGEHSKMFIFLPGNVRDFNTQFKALIDAEGFVYEGLDGGYEVFQHVERNILMKPWLVNIAESPIIYGAIAFRAIPPKSGVAPQFKIPALLKAADINIAK